MTCSGGTPYCVALPVVPDAGPDASDAVDGSDAIDASDTSDADAAGDVAMHDAADATPEFNGQSFYTYTCESRCPTNAPMMCGATGSCTDPMTDPHICGGCQAGCSAPSNGLPVCMGGSCSYTCIPGTHACPNACADDFSVNTCGSSCMPCVLPPHAVTTTCDGTSCGVVCATGYEAQQGTCVPFPDPQLIAPLSVAMLNTASPKLTLQMPMSDTTAQLAVCRDRACSMVVANIPVTGMGRQQIQVPSALPTGTYFWRATTTRMGVASAQSSPTWEFVVPPLPTTAPTVPAPTAAMGFVLDFDGDGFADVVVANENPSTLVFGSSSGLSDQQPLPQSNNTQSYASALADVDGDGFADLALGDTTGGGGMIVCHGQPRTNAAAPTCNMPTGSFSLDVAFSAGDFDGDGYGDVVGGQAGGGGGLRMLRINELTIGFGPGLSMMGLPSNGNNTACSAIGDFNADGLGDFACGNNGNSQAMLFLGNTGRQLTNRLINVTNNGAVINWVGGARDVNGDGYADMAFASMTSLAATEIDTGYCLGNQTGACAPVPQQPLSISNLLGLQQTDVVLIGAGDSTGDGYADEAMAALGWAKTSGGMTGPQATWQGWFSEPPTCTGTCRSDDMTGADFNGDGQADLVFLDGSTGQVEVYPANGTTTTLQFGRRRLGRAWITSVSAMAR